MRANKIRDGQSNDLNAPLVLDETDFLFFSLCQDGQVYRSTKLVNIYSLTYDFMCV